MMVLVFYFFPTNSEFRLFSVVIEHIMSDEFLRAYHALVEKHHIPNPLIAANAVVAHTVALAAGEAKGPQKRALLIGINYFSQDSELHGCQNDIDNVQAYLKGCGYTEFTVLKDVKGDKNHTAPNSPTKANILAAMKSVVAKTKAGDCLYIHYSGHGSHMDDKNSDETDGQDECICPVDFAFDHPDSGFIRDDDLNATLVQALAPGAKLRVCFDSCHSGSALDLPFRWVSNTRMVTENMTKSDRDIIFISGCMDSQTSADASFAGQAAGAMTWSLLTSLYDVKKSGKHAETWTWKELVQMMRLNLRKEQYDQIPQLGLTHVDQAGSYVDLL